MFLGMIRRWYYKRGKRPKAGSILYSPTLNLTYGRRDVFIRANSMADVVQLWESARDNGCIDRVNSQEDSMGLTFAFAPHKKVTVINWVNEAHGALDMHMTFCPMCGNILQRSSTDQYSKECPGAHGRAYVTDSPDGSQAVIIFEPYGMD